MFNTRHGHNESMHLLSFEWPNYRFQAISVLVWLADQDEQDAWRMQPAETRPPMIWVAEVALDDTGMLEHPSKQIGGCLVDGPEIERLKELGEVLIPFLGVTSLPTGAEFLDDPGWPEVVRRARRALTAMLDAGWFNLEADQNPT